MCSLLILSSFLEGSKKKSSFKLRLSGSPSTLGRFETLQSLREMLSRLSPGALLQSEFCLSQHQACG